MALYIVLVLEDLNSLHFLCLITYSRETEAIDCCDS